MSKSNWAMLSQIITDCEKAIKHATAHAPDGYVPSDCKREWIIKEQFNANGMKIDTDVAQTINTLLYECNV